MLFVPTNNALRPGKDGAAIAAEASTVDVATAIANRMWVVRADVTGQTSGLTSFGSSAIVDPNGSIVQAARAMSDDVIAAVLSDDGIFPKKWTA